MIDRARLVIVIAIAIVIVIAGSIIFIRFRGDDSSSISQDGESSPTDLGTAASPTRPETVPVSINAIPWARVFIKIPENDYFMEPRAGDFTVPPEPNGRNSNVTPIPGNLKVPIGTTIKLMYRGKEKIFFYDTWKDEKAISHDFLSQ